MNTIAELVRLSASASSMRPSPTIAANNAAKALAGELQKQNKELVPMTLGETPFAPDLHVIEGMAKKYADFATIFAKEKTARENGEALSAEDKKAFAAAVSFFKYSPVPGKDDTRDAVANYTKEYGMEGIDKTNVIISNGAKHSISNLVEATIGQGDEAMIFSPAWVSYFDLVKMSGGKVNEVACSGVPTPDQVRQALRDHPNTKLLMLNPVSNPTGGVMSQDDRNEIAEIIREERTKRGARRQAGEENVPDLMVMVDDIYKDLRFDGQKHRYTENEQKLFNEGGMIIVDGLAKSFDLTGTRIGWAVGPKDLVQTMTTIQTNRTSNIPGETQYEAVLALTSPNREKLLEDHIEIFKRRKDIVVNGLQGIDGISIDEQHTPKGAFYVYANVKDLFGKKVPQTVTDPYGQPVDMGNLGNKTLNSADDVANYLLKAAYVAGTSGNGFRDDGVEDGHLRLSVGGEDAKLQEAIRRIGGALKQLEQEKTVEHWQDNDPRAKVLAEGLIHSSGRSAAAGHTR